MNKVRVCPTCAKEYPDEGVYLEKCSCGYCRHASITSGKCDQCGATNPSLVTISDATSRAKDASK